MGSLRRSRIDKAIGPTTKMKMMSSRMKVWTAAILTATLFHLAQAAARKRRGRDAAAPFPLPELTFSSLQQGEAACGSSDFGLETPTPAKSRNTFLCL